MAILDTTRLQFELHRRLLLSRDLLNARSCGSLGQLNRHPHRCIVRVVITVGGYHLAGVHGAAAAVLAERAARFAAILGCM